MRSWLQRDVFDEAGIIARVDKGEGATDGRLVLLRTQYRMHPSIAAIPNDLFYNHQLRDDLQVVRTTQVISDGPPGPGQVLALHDLGPLGATCYTERESYSRFNLLSALIAVSLAAECRPGPPPVPTPGIAPVMETPSVGIITPYNAQARLIHRLLRDTRLSDRGIKVATVHRFQGSEQDVIIFDTVEGPPQSKPGLLLLGSMNSTAMRLVNVAISRARGKFIGLLHRPYLRTHLSPDSSVGQVLDAVAAEGVVQTVTWPKAGDINPLALPGLTLFPTSPPATTALEADLAAAKEEVVVYWPRTLERHHFSLAALQGRNAQLRFFITTRQGQPAFYTGLQNTRIWELPNPTDICVVGIDRRRLWIYLAPETPAGPVLRLDYPGTTQLLYAFWRLVPDEELKEAMVEDRLAEGKGPVGIPCPRCGGALWPSTGRWGVALLCTSGGCGYTKSITAADATELARFMNIQCGACGQQVKGRKSYNGVFLGCVNYPACTWTRAIEALV